MEWLEPYAHFIAGTAAGIASKCIEYPLDTVKVRVQTQSGSMSTMDIMRQTLRDTGVVGIFKGIAAPLAFAAAENAVIFCVYGESQDALRNLWWKDSPVSLAAFCGGLSGIGVAVVLTPVELLKCQLQARHTASNFSGTLPLLIHTYKANPGIKFVRHMYTGTAVTLLREIPGGVAYFGAYEACCVLLRQWNRVQELNTIETMLAGSLAGMSYWSLVYPIDVVKSRIQTGLTSNSGLFREISKGFVSEGISGMYRGLGITLVRAIPSNAVILAVYERVRRLFDSKRS